jgi:TPP-dependent pyruvate/acetoin dehydrogenase alpha subunit
MVKVKTFANELKIFRTMNELRELDEKVNAFLKENKIKKIVSVGDACTSDNTGATIGVIRVLAYEA